jgi:hypothetical protein
LARTGADRGVGKDLLLWLGGDGQADDWVQGGPAACGERVSRDSIQLRNEPDLGSEPQATKSGTIIKGRNAGYDFKSMSGWNLGLKCIVFDTIIASVGVKIGRFLPFEIFLG